MRDIPVWIVILAHNKKELTMRCIHSLKKSLLNEKAQLVVVDNASTDGTSGHVKKLFDGVKILTNKTNLGWTGGNNRGARYALKKGAKVVIFLNNDLVVDRYFLKNMVTYLNREKEVGIVGPLIMSINDKGMVQSAGYRMNARYYSEPIRSKKITHIGGEPDFVSGSALAVRSTVFKEIGLFDDNYFIYFDEADFCHRAKSVGFKIAVDHKSKIYHEEGGTNQLYSPFHSYFNTRNHLLFTQRYGKKKILVKEIIYSLNLALKKMTALSPEGLYIAIGVFDYITRRFGHRKYWK